MNIEVDTILTRYKKYLFILSHNEQIESINKVIKNHEKVIRKLKKTEKIDFLKELEQLREQINQ